MGINPMPLPISRFVLPEVCSVVRGNFWRDRPTRVAVEDRYSAFEIKRDLTFDHDILEDAISLTNKMLSSYLPEHQTPWVFADIWKEINKASGSGWPYLTKKGAVREQAFRDYSELLSSLQFDWYVPIYPCRMAARCVIREPPENKPRLVWHYPILMTLLEGRYALPLIKALADCPLMGWSYKWLDAGSGWRKWYASTLCSVWQYNLDYSGFDSCVPACLIRPAFSFFFGRFDFDGTKTDANATKLIMNYFIHTPIQMYDGVHQKHRGIPSGSYFTQILGSYVNLLIQNYSHIKRDLLRVRRSIVVLGDDSLVTFLNQNFEGRRYVEQITFDSLELGMIVNPEKVRAFRVTSDMPAFMKFLGMKLVSGWPNFLIDRKEAMARLALPETPDRGPDDTWIRLHGLVWAYGLDIHVYWIYLKQRRKLLRLWPYLGSLTSQDVAMSVRDPETSRWLRFVLWTDLDIMKWPTHNDICMKWRGYV